MARYDSRGVVIPAPLQGSDAALAGKRYGDKHRGPAVSDAYELWHCRFDLADRSERWSEPADYEEVDRRISYAIRTGELPVWVAPQGEPERLVAVGALATIDKRSIGGGVFCPRSEEHKSDADRPWLWERPLFVKWDDWVRFATSVHSSLAPGTESVVPANRQLDHASILAKAKAMLSEQRNLSKGSAAASIVAELPPNPKTGKPRDTRHIERMIAPLWEGGLSQSPV